MSAALNVPDGQLSEELTAIVRKVANCPQQLVHWLVKVLKTTLVNENPNEGLSVLRE